MEVLAEEILQLSKRELRVIIADPEKSAQAVNLIYVHDTAPGIKRIKKGKKFDYIAKETIKVTSEKDLVRIKSLVIPPAWEQVWICELENGHLQNLPRCL